MILSYFSQISILKDLVEIFFGHDHELMESKAKTEKILEEPDKKYLYNHYMLQDILKAELPLSGM